MQFLQTNPKIRPGIFLMIRRGVSGLDSARVRHTGQLHGTRFAKKRGTRGGAFSAGNGIPFALCSCVKQSGGKGAREETKVQKMEIEEIRNLVEKLAGDMLPKGELVKVHVREDEDWEGGKILDVIIVFEGKKKLDHKKTLRLGPLVHKKLVESGDSRFPMIDFVVKDEAGMLGIAIP